MGFRKIALLTGSIIALASIPAIGSTVAEAPESSTSITQVAEEQNVVTASESAEVRFDYLDLPATIRNEQPIVQATAVEAEAEPELQVETPAVEAPVEAPVAAQPVIEPEVVEVPYSRIVNVSLAGGQDVVDMGAGPVLFPLPANFPPYVAEHDYAGGWERFGTLTVGMNVTMTGLVTGDYVVGQTITVPKGANTDSLYGFATMPTVLLQTCIPGTDMMVVVGLY